MELHTPQHIAAELVGRLKRQNLKIVFAESCTGGLAAAMMTGVPGVSNYFCGSAVTYRIDTKSQWLGIDADLINAHTPESPETSLAMAIGILDRTPEADVAVAVTGHLGPNAPPEKDGIIYVAIAIGSHKINNPPTSPTPAPRTTRWQRIVLPSVKRSQRQQDSAIALIRYAAEQIDFPDDGVAVGNQRNA
jgi:PncC family amidohydrolase